MNKSFWNGKKVFLTGHTGFKGSWLVMMLKNAGAKVAGYSNTIPTNPSLFESCKISEFLDQDFRGDIADDKFLRSCVNAYQPEIIFHLAAQPLVRLSYHDPIETYKTNVMGTLSLLMAANECNSVKVIINVTTDKCYQNNEWSWGYREIDPLGGYDPYSSSKACVEILSNSIRNSFLNNTNKAMATARAGNVIGGGDWAENRIIPDFMRAYLNKEKLVIRNPESTRPWQHVLEPLAGYTKLAERLYGDFHFSGAWNFGPNDNDCRSVDYIVSYLKTLMPGHLGLDKEKVSSNLHEAKLLKLDCSKAKIDLNWQPKLSLEKALDFTADWYQSYFSLGNLRKKSLEQINIYEGLG